MKDGCVIGSSLPGDMIGVAPEGGAGGADDVGCGKPVGSALEALEEMLFLRGKDAGLVAPPGTGDVGSLGVELLGGDHDLVVGAALSLVTGDNITVAKVPEAGWYELSLPGLQGAVGTELLDSKDLAVHETRLTMVAADENLVARTKLDGSWQRDGELLHVFADVDRPVVTIEPQPARFN